MRQDPAVAASRSAVARSRGVRWAMAGITVAVLVADQVTKSLVAAGRIRDGSSLGWLTVAAERGYVDDVIDPADTRRGIVRSLDLLASKREELPRRKHGNIPL